MRMFRFLPVLLVFSMILVGYRIYREQFRGIWPALLPPTSLPTAPPHQSDSSTVSPTTSDTFDGLSVNPGFHLPPGFSISIFARELGTPRMLLYQEFNQLFDEYLHDHQEALLVSIPSEGKVVSLRDLNGDGVAERMKTLIAGLNRPHGIALNCSDGGSCSLFVAQSHEVTAYSYTELVQTGKATGSVSIFKMPDGGNHFTRTIKIGPDGRLYISIGSSCNACVEKDPLRATIYSLALASDEEPKLLAQGLRNSVFFTWHPKTRKMWATEMGRDILGDDLPPDEINIVEEGKDYGWPFCYGKNEHDTIFDKRVFDLYGPGQKTCEILGKTPSHIDLPAHSAPLGLTFIPENSNWPKDYWGNLLVAYHGSWNRSTPTGYKIIRIKLDEHGNSEGIEDFITGWLSPAGEVSGRPVDLLFSPDGTLYISDDKANVVYKVTYHTP